MEAVCLPILDIISPFDPTPHATRIIDELLKVERAVSLPFILLSEKNQIKQNKIEHNKIKKMKMKNNEYALIITLYMCTVLLTC